MIHSFAAGSQAVLFADRSDAGRQLALRLEEYKKTQPLVLALPRGGVVVGYEVATYLHAPLEVIVSRKVGIPYNPELGIGAVSEEGVLLLNTKTLSELTIPVKETERVITREEKELTRRIELYRGGKSLPTFEGKTVILVDDGVATGVTAQAAIKVIRKHTPRKLVCAVPICARDTSRIIAREVDAFICLHSPDFMQAIGLYYKNFKQVTDEEVVDLLTRSHKDRLFH